MYSIISTFLLLSTALAFPGDLGSLGFIGNTRLGYCDFPPSPLIEVISVNIKQGGPRSVTVTAKTKTDITDGAISAVDLKLPILGGPGQQFNFCKDLGVTCPVTAGTTFTATHNFTAKFFPGFWEDRYNVQVLWARSTDFPPDFLLCLDGPWKTSGTTFFTQGVSEAEQRLVGTNENLDLK